MRIQDTQLKRFVIDSGLVSRKDIDAAEKDFDKGLTFVGSNGSPTSYVDIGT